MALIFTTLTLNSKSVVSGCGCGFGFERKYWRIDGFGEKKARIYGFANYYSSPPRPAPNVSNYTELAFQDYCIFSIYNPITPVGLSILYFYVSVSSIFFPLFLLPFLIRRLVFFFFHTKFLLRKTKYTPQKKTNARNFGS